MSTDASSCAGSAGHELRERARAAGGCGDRDHEARRRASGVRRRVLLRRCERAVVHAGEIHLRRRAQRDEQLVANRREIEADRPRRLSHELHRAALERAQRHLVARARRRREHDDRARRLAHDALECAEAVELRHLDVERHDVGLERLHLQQRVDAVARGADHAKLVGALDELRDELAHEGAVVDDEHRRKAARGRHSPSPSTSPRTARRSRAGTRCAHGRRPHPRPSRECRGLRARCAWR